MDDNTDRLLDDDISLEDINHGLDTSQDEHVNDKEKLGSPTRRADKRNDQKEFNAAQSQIDVLQDMILEIREGFQAALIELTKIQTKDEDEDCKKLQNQQQEQLANLTETISEIKLQLNSLTTSVQQIKDEQKLLKDGLEEIRSTRDSSQEHRLPNDSTSNLLDDLSSSEESSSKFTEPPTVNGNQHIVDKYGKNITATACKSLNLTQTLGEQSQKYNLILSSSDESEDLSLSRGVNYRHNQTHFDPDMIDRQDNMSIYNALQERSQNITNTVQRQRAVAELADSEREYCSKLWSLQHTYLASLQTAGLLSTRELEILIPPYLDQLYTEHCQMCTELQGSLMHWTFITSVANQLSTVVGYSNSQDSLLSLYKEYAVDLPVALSFLRRALAQSSELKYFLKAVKHSSCQSEDLISLLLAPVQRIPKYLLQVQEIFRQTPPSHIDFPHLQALVHQLQNFVDQLNAVLSGGMEDLNHDRHESQAEWTDSSYYTAPHRQVWISPSQNTSSSHPDLTYYSHTNSVTSDHMSSNIIPHSQSSQPATGDSLYNGGSSVPRQRIQKFKVKMRSPSPARYTTKTQDYNNMNLQPTARPASSVDFLRHQNQQHPQHQQHSDLSEMSRSLQPRSHSALGLHSMSTSHRPVVISRKSVKQPHTSLPQSKFWDESISSATLPTRMLNKLSQFTSSCSQPLTRHTSDIINGHQTDAQSMDSNSFEVYDTNSDTVSHGPNVGYETELNVTQSQVHNHNNQNNSLYTNSQKSSDANSLDTSQKMSNSHQEHVDTNSRLVKQFSNNMSSSSTTKLKEQIKLQSNHNEASDLPKPSIIIINKNHPPRSSNNKIKVIHPSRISTNSNQEYQQHSKSKNVNNEFLERSLPVYTSHDIDKYIARCDHRPITDLVNKSLALPSRNSIKTSKISSAEQHFVGDNEMSSTLHEKIKSSITNDRELGGLESNGPADFKFETNGEQNRFVNGNITNQLRNSLKDEGIERNNFVLERNESSVEGRKRISKVQEENEVVFVQGRSDRNGVKAIQYSEKSVDSNSKVKGKTQISENNRQFLMSLTSKSSSVEKTNLVKALPGLNTEAVGNLSSLNIEPHYSNEDSTNLYPGVKVESVTSESHLPPRSSARVGKNSFGQPTAKEHPTSKAHTKPAIPPKKHLQIPATPSPKKNITVSGANPDDSFFTLEYGQEVLNQKGSSSNVNFGSSSVLSNNSSNINETASNHGSVSKSNKQSSQPSPPCASDVTPYMAKKEVAKNGADIGDNDLDSCNGKHNLQPLIQSDLHLDGQNHERWNESIKTDGVCEENRTNSDNFMQPNEDPATRKKSHFKASLKNLFAKKK